MKTTRYCFADKEDSRYIRQKYCTRFCENAKTVAEGASLNDHADGIAEAMHTAAKENYGVGRTLRKPWVSQEIVDLMNLREEARK